MARRNSTNELGLGEDVKKMTDAFSKDYKVGGIGLVLVVFGMVVILFLFLFHSSLPIWLIVVFICVGSASIYFGVRVLLKKEKMKRSKRNKKKK